MKGKEQRSLLIYEGGREGGWVVVV